MNDSMKILDSQKQVPRPSGSSDRPALKADMPLWETPKYLQENAFPIPKEDGKPKEPGNTSDKKGGSNKNLPSGKKKSSSKKHFPAKKKADRPELADGSYIRRSPIQSWFNTFMIMNIPIIGWIYLFILALSKKDQRKDFAKAYLVYKLVFFLLALAIIAFCLYVGMEVADRLLRYINML